MKKFKTDFYTTWTSRDGTTHKISEMTTAHIFNCMKLIVMSLFPEDYKDNTVFLNKDFIQKHGKNYTKAFYRELSKRSFITKQKITR